MRKFLLCLLMAWVLTAPAGAVLPDDLKSVCVLVRADAGSGAFGFVGTVSGTGFFVAPDLLVTCAHLSRIPGVFGTSQAGRFLVEMEPGLDVEARLVMQDPHRDLALLRVARATGGSPLAVKPFSLRSGQEVAIVGNFPASIQVTRGTVVSPSVSQGFALASAKVRGGFSGGPVFGPDGSVQGVLSQRDDDYNAIFVPSDVVLDMLRSYESRTGRKVVLRGAGGAGKDGRRTASHHPSRAETPRKKGRAAPPRQSADRTPGNPALHPVTAGMLRIDQGAPVSGPDLADRPGDHEEDLVVAVPTRKKGPAEPPR